MRVLMLGWELPPYNSGGLGVACYSLAKHLSKRGADITFTVAQWYDAYGEIAFMRVVPAIATAYQYLPSFSPYDSRSYRLRSTRADVVRVSGIFDVVNLYKEGMIKLANQGAFEVDVIHAHDWLTVPAALELKRILKKPLVIHIHATEYDRSGGNGGNSYVRDLERTVTDQADLIFPVSKYTASVLTTNFDAARSKIRVAYNGPSPKGLPGDDERSALYSGALDYISMLKGRGWNILMSLGRLTIQKNLVNLFHAVANVIYHHPQTLFVVCGDGEQKNELVQLAADSGISENLFWGSEAQKALAYKNSLYSLADLFLMPSQSEPFGITPLEALDNNTLPIVSHTCGVHETLPSLVAVDFWDVDKLSTEISELLDNPYRREKLLEAAREEYAKLSWDDTADIVISGYRQVMGGR